MGAFDREHGRRPARPEKQRRARMAGGQAGGQAGPSETRAFSLLYSAGHELDEVSVLVKQREKQVALTLAASSTSFLSFESLRVRALLLSLP